MAAVATSRDFASDPLWRQTQTFLVHGRLIPRKRLEQHVEAPKLLGRARELGHASAALRFHRGEASLFNGRIEEAETEFAASLADTPARGRIAEPLVHLRKQMPERSRFAALAEYFCDYRRVMVHRHNIVPGSILDASYANLVHEPETTLRNVFAFCGLQWESGCTDLKRNTAPSATLSAAQVRSRVRADTQGQWKRYTAHLSTLRVAMEAQ